MTFCWKIQKAFGNSIHSTNNKGPNEKADTAWTVKNILIPEAQMGARSISSMSGDVGVWTKRKLKSTKQRAWDRIGSTKMISHEVITHHKTHLYTAQSQPTNCFHFSGWIWSSFLASMSLSLFWEVEKMKQHNVGKIPSQAVRHTVITGSYHHSFSLAHKHVWR